NMGKYLDAARVGDLFTISNPARRISNTYTRAWTDADGDRVIDCNPLDFSTNTDPVSGDACGAAIVGTASDPARFGRDPLALDGSGRSFGLATTPCGLNDAGVPASVASYCGAASQNVLDGWSKRRQEWQLGVGVQHEIQPQVAVELF